MGCVTSNKCLPTSGPLFPDLYKDRDWQDAPMRAIQPQMSGLESSLLVLYGPGTLGGQKWSWLQEQTWFMEGSGGVVLL